MFGVFDCFLVVCYFVCIVYVDIGEYVWVMVLYFVVDCMGDFGEGKCFLFFGYVCVEYYLQQQVVKFVVEIVQVVVVDCIGDFIGFFDGVGGDGCEVLFQILWVVVLWVVQLCYDCQQVFQFVVCGVVGGGGVVCVYVVFRISWIISCVMVGWYY